MQFYELVTIANEAEDYARKHWKKTGTTETLMALEDL